jgi:hypothetical protein
VNPGFSLMMAGLLLNFPGGEGKTSCVEQEMRLAMNSAAARSSSGWCAMRGFQPAGNRT